MRHGDREKHIENIVASRTNCVIEPVRNIYEQISSDFSKNDFLQYKRILLAFSCHPNLLEYLSDSLNLGFPTHSLQIHCFGLFGPKFIHLLG